ncbi:hypothetical protein QYE76_064851 [Lolium multiflorum]|uniref:Uncharacterized protein n=1 Tax=Lolium multiflorum TaxID=4521 RepID=A0AAD8S7B4_LOLMU|nr:hypothetical protein QYE76_064851 [Lolium multiflorum]
MCATMAPCDGDTSLPAEDGSCACVSGSREIRGERLHGGRRRPDAHYIPSSPVEVVEVIQVASDSTTGTVVVIDSSTGTVVLPASSPGSPASPTSVLRVAPLTRLLQHGFKDQQMKKVAADVLAFAGVHVTTLQLYSHIRNWRTKWSVIMKMKSDRILDWSEDGCCFYGDDEETADEYIQRYRKHRQYVGTPITNNAQMKMIFTPQFVCKAQLFQPNLLVRDIDFIADNEAEHVKYRKLQPSERRSWLRTWLCNQFHA